MGCSLLKPVFGQIRTSVQSDQGLHCPLTESLDTTECMNGKQRAGWYFEHGQDDLNLCIFHMFKRTILLDVPHIKIYIVFFLTPNLKL